MRNVPKSQRCACGPNYKSPAGSGGKGLLARIFGR
jgi:hypothetical protein